MIMRTKQNEQNICAVMGMFANDKVTPNLNETYAQAIRLQVERDTGLIVPYKYFKYLAQNDFLGGGYGIYLTWSGAQINYVKREEINSKIVPDAEFVLWFSTEVK